MPKVILDIYLGFFLTNFVCNRFHFSRFDLTFISKVPIIEAANSRLILVFMGLGLHVKN